MDNEQEKFRAITDPLCFPQLNSVSELSIAIAITKQKRPPNEVSTTGQVGSRGEYVTTQKERISGCSEDSIFENVFPGPFSCGEIDNAEIREALSAWEPVCDAEICQCIEEAENRSYDSQLLDDLQIKLTNEVLDNFKDY